MKTDNQYTFRAAWRSVVACLITAVVLAGCGDMSITGMSGSGGESGGGVIVGGVGTGGTGVVRSSITTTGITVPSGSSALIGAVVFVDTNGNGLLDQGEPSAVTDQNGNYTLPEANSAEFAAYPLLMQAVAGTTIDKLTGQVVTSSYLVVLR